MLAVQGELSLEPLPVAVLVTRLGAAIVLGGLLGLERELKGKPAGLRTHMMVALGAACFSIAALEFTAAASARLGAPIAFDPSKVAEGIVTGIGFLGAGSIIQNRGSVEGLTTAGSIWLVGSIGLAAGAGAYLLASLAVALALVILRGLAAVESRIARHRRRAREL